ncbi:LacI family DNA-binding transcriptional regulator [Lentzea flava]|uniref:LacI family transcriptional regulator n=1 Tax=Lentzea flava TaxID=103732 RepID=A0ABQ2VBM8_9PSEU|nr:LacI family DNA-binding transcriptional regulator [Lentzea flava]MCP2204516.1 transcriptional regulator, LacI family [Lentzea flava]GGU78130.1 LacI family transcriptional regulator [Lentzea flava]
MVTIAEVARHAGVAPSTVFYVLTGKRPISPETTTRVHDSMIELGYRPPAAARPVPRDRADVVALVLPPGDAHPRSITRLVSSIAVAARGHEMDVLLVAPAGLRRAADSVSVNGFLVLEGEGADERVRVLRELGRTSVLIGRSDAEKDLVCVDLDFEAAGARCVDHLADLGHRGIGFLGASRAGVTQRTFAGFGAAAMRRGVVGTALPVAAGPGSVAGAISAVLRAYPEMTALVVHNEVALGRVIDCLRAQHLRVPQDIAVVAVCPDEPVERMAPPLTSVELAVEDLGGAAVDLLVSVIGGARPPALTLVPPRLVRRASCSLPVPRLSRNGTVHSGPPQWN